ncbi:MAG: hypothetical protein ACRD3Q_19580 [Terriglobales bacterium]
MLPDVDYSVNVPVPVDDAFASFKNLDRLLKRGIYADAIWIDGVPWQAGSRLRYTLLKPVSASVSAVVTAISPPRSITILNHALGITAEQHVSFGPDLKGGTRIRMTMVLVGKSTELSENEVKQAVTFITRDALDTVVADCQRRHASSAPGK